MYGYESSATLTTHRLHYKLQTSPLVRESAPRWRAKQIVRQKEGKRKIWSWAPVGCPTARGIGRLTVGHNINWTQLKWGGRNIMCYCFKQGRDESSSLMGFHIHRVYVILLRQFLEILTIIFQRKHFHHDCKNYLVTLSRVFAINALVPDLMSLTDIC
jgi:hypothetical protein